MAVARLGDLVLQRVLRPLRLRVLCRARVGRGVEIEDGCHFHSGALIELGDHVHVGRQSTFYIIDISEILRRQQRPVVIGSRTWISPGLLLHSVSGVEIGSNVLIGEYVSIRDNTHQHDRTDVCIIDQRDVFGTIRIEDDVWIGRGCLIQGQPAGLVIGRGAIVAANSVVTRSVPPMEIWGGTPARLIRRRESADSEHQGSSAEQEAAPDTERAVAAATIAG